jgi:hypothetical protein
MGVPGYTQLSSIKFLISITKYILEIHISPGYTYIFELSLPIFVNRYVEMSPCRGKYSTDCVSLYLYMDASKETPLKSGMVVQATLSILDQNNGEYFTGTTGSALATISPML